MKLKRKVRSRELMKELVNSGGVVVMAAKRLGSTPEAVARYLRKSGGL